MLRIPNFLLLFPKIFRTCKMIPICSKYNYCFSNLFEMSKKKKAFKNALYSKDILILVKFSELKIMFCVKDTHFLKIL